MAPVNVDVAEVEAQLSAVRRRRNSLATQRALAAGLSTALLGGSLVVLAALRGSPGLFANAVMLAAGGTAACVGYVVWQTWRDWLSLAATAHLADSRATLKNRLTTLLAVASLSPAPPLRPLLLDQVLQARQQWGAERLAPRRLSPWLALVPLAAAVLIATTFYARPPGAGAMRRFGAAAPALPSSPPIPARAPGSSSASPPLTESAAAGPPQAAAARNPPRASSSTDAASSRAGADAGAAGVHAPLAGAVAGIDLAAGALDRLRQSIQRTLGAPAPETNETPRGTDGDTARSAGRASVPDQRQGRTSDAPQPGEAERDPATAPVGGQRPAPANRVATAAGGSRGNRRGGAASGGASGLLGAAAQPASTNAARPMAIKLGAIVAASASQAEPQRRHDVPAAAADANRAARPIAPLAEEQLPDATVHPLNVGPEHEGLIRRIFTRE